jgi:hypothetical protein
VVTTTETAAVSKERIKKELNPLAVTELITQSQFSHCTQEIPKYGN